MARGSEGAGVALASDFMWWGWLEHGPEYRSVVRLVRDVEHGPEYRSVVRLARDVEHGPEYRSVARLARDVEHGFE